MQDYSGKIIGGCKVLKKIGEGGMGVIYEAEQTSLSRKVAVKFLSPHLSKSDDFVSRFLREARSAAGLCHPHVLQVHDVGQEGNLLYMITEFVEGETLKDLVNREGPLSEERALSIVCDIASALVEADEKHIVHRDLKPDNVMITNKSIIKVMDFGLAKHAAGETQAITQTGALLGTPHYMSPEQIQGEKVDIRSDLYALGLILFFLVTGQTCFKGKSAVEIFHQQVYTPISDPKDLRKDLSEALRSLILKLTRKNPDERFQNPKEVVSAIDLLKRDKVLFTETMRKTLKEETVLSQGRGNKKIFSLFLIILIVFSASLSFYFFKIRPSYKEKSSEALKVKRDMQEKSYDELIREGQELVNKKEWDRALTIFQTALKDYPDEQGTQMWLDLTLKKKEKESESFIKGELVQPGKLTVLIQDYKPFFFKDESGEWAGFDHDLIASFAGRMNLSMDILPLDNYDDLIPGLLGKKGDIIACGMTMTKAREELIVFSYPCLTNAEVLVTLDGSSVSTAADLADKILGFQPGTTYEETAKTIQVSSTKEFRSDEEMISALKSGEIDACILDLPTAMILENNDPAVNIAFTFEKLEKIAYGLSQSAPHLKKALDTFLKQAEESGLTRESYRKYFENRQ
ncbi:MAG: transporter substrate-binding domain-containing protein [Candidatus Aureabacteria bacterium]|nr:transporter substrate-binding domain-containing protein [Candidatus Auribacterota bacterium]